MNNKFFSILSIVNEQNVSAGITGYESLPRRTPLIRNFAFKTAVKKKKKLGNK